MPAKPIFSDEQYEILRATVERLLKTRRFKDQKQLALAIGVTQQSVSNMLHGKYRPGLKVAHLIAEADGQELEDLVGPYGKSESSMPPGGISGSARPNLEVCVSFHAGTKNWHPWTLAAARAGIFGPDDFPAPAWTPKLDALESTLARFQKGAGV